MTSIESVKSLVLELPPSCVEFSPLAPQYAVVGTYNLEKQHADETAAQSDEAKGQTRNGSLILIHVDNDDV